MTMMDGLIKKYILELGEGISVLDVGSKCCDPSSGQTYKELLKPYDIKYTGLDLGVGCNVDLVVNDPYNWKELKGESFELVISGQAFEHISFPWLTIKEIARVMKPNGLCFIIAPTVAPEHKYPVDCYRYLPDGFHALVNWAGLTTLECGTNTLDDIMQDCYIVAEKLHG